MPFDAGIFCGSGDRPALAQLPPVRIKLPRGPITHSWEVAESPHGARRTKASAAQRAGLAYQRRVERFLAPARPSDWKLRCGPWFAYGDDSPGRRYCQPDFVLDMGASLCCVVEAKSSWTPDAWWQLEQLYKPVLLASRRWREVILLCVAKNYDPANPPPSGPPRIVSDVFEAQPGIFNLLIHR